MAAALHDPSGLLRVRPVTAELKRPRRSSAAPLIGGRSPDGIGGTGESCRQGFAGMETMRNRVAFDAAKDFAHLRIDAADFCGGEVPAIFFKREIEKDCRLRSGQRFNADDQAIELLSARREYALRQDADCNGWRW